MAGVAGRGMHMGWASYGWHATRPEHHLLVLGPPRSGKTASIMIPVVLSSALSPVVSASTKPDVFQATALARSILVSPGSAIWVFDPAGTSGPTPGAAELRWSPLGVSVDWDLALGMANQMVEATRPQKGSAEAA